MSRRIRLKIEGWSCKEWHEMMVCNRRDASWRRAPLRNVTNNVRLSLKNTSRLVTNS